MSKERFIPSSDTSFVTDPDVISGHLTEMFENGTVLGADDRDKAYGPYSHLEDKLKGRIVGQDPAVEAVVEALNFEGFANPNEPLGTFMFLGPTGVGKTQLAKELALNLHNGTTDGLVVINCTQLKHPGDISMLQGAPIGYINHGDPTLLDEKRLKQPKSVLVFDEVEKAHPALHDFLLQILDEGQMTSFSTVEKLSLRDSVVILTSNAGSQEVNEALGKKEMGFHTAEGEQRPPLSRDKLTEIALNSLEKIFRPELINRIDSKVQFTHLTDEQHALALTQYINEINSRDGFRQKGIHFGASPELLDMVVKDSDRRSVGGFREVKSFFKIAVEKDLINLTRNGKIPEYSFVQAVPASEATKSKNPEVYADYRYSRL